MSALDADTLRRLGRLLRETGELDDAELPRETRGAKPAARARATESEASRSTSAGLLWDLEVQEAWGRTIPINLPSTGEHITVLVEYDRFRVRDGSGAEGMLYMNITTRVNNIT